MVSMLGNGVAGDHTHSVFARIVKGGRPGVAAARLRESLAWCLGRHLRKTYSFPAEHTMVRLTAGPVALAGSWCGNS